MEWVLCVCMDLSVGMVRTRVSVVGLRGGGLPLGRSGPEGLGLGLGPGVGGGVGGLGGGLGGGTCGLRFLLCSRNGGCMGTR